jgi:chromosome segregation ATPase
MKDVVVTLPTRDPLPKATFDKNIDPEEDQVPIVEVISEAKDELTNQESFDQPDEQTRQLRNKQNEAAIQKTLHEQRDEISMHLSTIHNQTEEILHHQQVIRDQQSEITKHYSVVADKDKEILMHVKVNQDQEKDISSLTKSNKDKAKNIRELSQQIQTLQQELDQSKADLAGYTENFHELVKHVEEAEQDKVRMSRRIEHLERCIAETRSPEAPNKVESYYIKKLERLNQYISSKVADLCKREHAKTFRASERAINNVLRTLQELEPHGGVAATMLGQGSLWTLDTDVRRRIAVIRHIIALFLQSCVFDSFAFGLDPHASLILRKTEDTISKIGIS